VNSLESFAGGEALSVDVTSIERELADLWKSAAEPGEGVTLTRACQFNLVACCDGPAQARLADTVLSSISSQCPSRAILVVVDPVEGSDRLDAAISAHCVYTAGAGRGRQVCCEQITLTGSGSGAQRLPGAVLPLLLPDLPVAVWYPGDPRLESRGVFESVSRVVRESADRLVLDGRLASHPWETMRVLASLELPLADLAWQRLRGWREMVASFFDGPGFETMPARLTRLTATWAAPSDAEPSDSREMPGAAEAILLSCWAASRLKWTPPAPGVVAAAADRMMLQRPAGQRFGEIVLEAQPSDRSTGQVLSFVLEADDATFRVERSGMLDCVTATATMPQACPIPRSARVPEREEAALLCRSLEPSGSDPVHLEALRLAARLAGALPFGETR
jgi:glucose-6-phosphate dehydrogenase assembly protein OpcA